MKSRIEKTLRLGTDEADIRRAGEIIRDGGLVAFPTETVYGLGADALNELAVKSVYEAKGRPSDNPMIVHISKMEELDAIVRDVDDLSLMLMKELWPGPITFVLHKRDVVPDATSGSLDTLGVRMPSNDIARALIAAAERPIAAPSANLSGRPSPTTSEDVLEDMDGRIDAVIEGALSDIGIESTVLDCTGDIPTILRPGYITAETIKEITGIEVAYDKSLLCRPKEELNPSDGAAEIEDFKPKSPGMKYKHYSPKAKVQIVMGDIEKCRREAEEKGIKTAVLDYGEDSKEAARNFFADLRKLDRAEVELIFVRALDEEGLGFSIMNRMLKSAGYDVIK